eukprot:INCI16282.4.p1 GENE.INCI16282.4~~INCI16282.4.p1  ORF type:complete len:1564 (+),score=486.44 INCI16282.4:139-4830(+)
MSADANPSGGVPTAAATTTRTTTTTAAAAAAQGVSNGAGGGNSPQGKNGTWYSGFLKLPAVESLKRVANRSLAAAREMADQALALDEDDGNNGFLDGDEDGMSTGSDSDSGQFVDTVEAADVREARNLKSMMADMEEQHITAAKEYKKMFHNYRCEQEALLALLDGPQEQEALATLREKFGTGSEEAARASASGDELELFRLQCRELVEQKIDLEAKLRAEADSLATVDGSSRILRTELDNAKAAMDKFYDEKSRFHDQKRQLAATHEERLDQMAQDYNRAAAKAEEAAISAHETIQSLEAKQAAVLQELASTKANMARELELAQTAVVSGAQTGSENIATDAATKIALDEAQLRFEDERRECEALQHRLTEEAAKQQLEREQLQKQVTKYQSMSEQKSETVENLQRQLLEQVQADGAGESAAVLALRSALQALEESLGAEKESSAMQAEAHGVQIADTQSELRALQSTFAATRQEMELEQSVARQLKAEHSEAVAAVSAAEQRRLEVSEASTAASAALESLLQAKEADLEAARGAVQASESAQVSSVEVHAAQEETDILHSRLATLEDELSFANNVASSQQAELDAAKARADKTGAALETASLTAAEHDSMVGKLRGEIADLEDTASRMRSQAESDAERVGEAAAVATTTLQQQVQQVEAECKSLRDSHAKALERQEEAAATRALAAAEAMAHSAEEGARRTAETETALMDELRAATDARTDATTKWEELTATHTALQKSHDELSAKLDQELGILQAERAAASTSQKAAAEQVESLSKQLQAATLDQTSLSEQAANSLTAVRQELADMTAARDADATKLASVESAHHEQVAHLEKMHAAATNEAQQAASEAEEAAREARDFQSELQSSHEAALKKHSDTASLEIESLEAKVTVEASLVEDLQTKLESVGEERTVAAAMAEANKQHEYALATKLRDAQQSALEAAAQADATARDLTAALQQEEAALQEALANGQAELAEAQATGRQLEENLLSLRSEHAQLEATHGEALEAAAAAAQEAAASLASKQSQLDELAAKAAAAAGVAATDLELVQASLDAVKAALADQEAAAAIAAQEASSAAAVAEEEHTQELTQAIDRERESAAQGRAELMAEHDEHVKATKAEYEAAQAAQEDAAKQAATEAAAAIGSLEEAQTKLRTDMADLVRNHEAALVKQQRDLQQLHREALAKQAQLAEETQAAASKAAADQLIAEQSAAAARLEATEQQAQLAAAEAKAASDAALAAANAETAAEAKRASDIAAKAAQDIAIARAEAAAEARKAMRGEIEDAYAKYNEELVRRKKVHNKLMEVQGNIQVLCRIRPVLQHEKEQNSEMSRSCFEFPIENDVILEGEDGTTRRFEFDRVFPGNATQEQIFEGVEGLTTSVTDGYSVCIFAYGQTGSGKTFTMEGPPDNPGINRRALSAIFAKAAKTAEAIEFKLEMSMLQIYNEKVQDLLADAKQEKDSLDIKRGPRGNYVEGLIWEPVNTMSQVEDIMVRGAANRSVGSHSINEFSSRSHLVLSLRCTTHNKVNGAKSRGLLHLIDLVSSRRCIGQRAPGKVALCCCH